MVRLEKIIYEQLVNSKQLKRARILARPAKPYSENRSHAFRLAAVKLYTQGITGSLFKLVEPFFARFFYNWTRDFALQRGLAMEDIVVFQDRELRRDYLFETIARTGLHPSTWRSFVQRRARYYKVERGVRGSYAPEWAQEEARQRTLADAAQLKFEWDDYVYNEFMSDMTPIPRQTVLQKVILLEIFSFYGLFRLEAWDRFFYNEVYYNGTQYTKQELANIPSGFPQFNSDEGKRQFEASVKRFIDLYPGGVVKEGETFDFDRFYALEAIKNGKDLSKFDTTLIQNLKSELNQKVEHKKSHGHKHSRFLPEWLRSATSRGILTQQ